jgi:hypothetical protein
MICVDPLCCAYSGDVDVMVFQGPGNAYYRSVQKLSSSRLLSKNIKIGVYKIIILPLVLYVCGTLSLTLREEQD